jgi:hypothetical protein
MYIYNAINDNNISMFQGPYLHRSERRDRSTVNHCELTNASLRLSRRENHLSICYFVMTIGASNTRCHCLHGFVGITLDGGCRLTMPPFQDLLGLSWTSRYGLLDGLNHRRVFLVVVLLLLGILLLLSQIDDGILGWMRIISPSSKERELTADFHSR